MNERRQKFRKGLSSVYLPYYDALCELVPETFQPYCGLRSWEDQRIAYSQRNSKAKAGESPHNYGCATDWALYEDGKFLWPPFKKVWQPYLNAIEELGLVSGAEFSFVDLPHNELRIKGSWKDVLKVYDEGDMDAAIKYVEYNRVKNGL